MIPVNEGVSYVRRNNSKIYRLILILSILCIGVLTEILPGKVFLVLSFLLVFILSISFSSRDLIQSALILFVCNGLMRRLAAKESGYFTENDIMIFICYIPILILIAKNFRDSKFEKAFLYIFSPISFFALLNLPKYPPNIAWGLINLIMAVKLGLIARKYLDDALVSFIVNLGIFSSIYVFIQKFALPGYDVGWCLSRRSHLVILENCTSNSTRLWGTMESAVNLACFLTTCFLLVIFKESRNISFPRRVIELGVLFSGIFLTGTRTFLFVIPIVFFITNYFFRILSFPKIIFGISSLVCSINLLPSLAVLFNYKNNWVSRLDLVQLSGDKSLRDRINLIATFQEEVSLRNLFIGDGLGSRSRGSLAIDNGFLSLVLELGLPLAALFLMYLIRNMKNAFPGNNFLIVQYWSVCFMLLIANISYVVLTGPSAVFFWFFFFSIGRGEESREVRFDEDSHL